MMKVFWIWMEVVTAHCYRLDATELTLKWLTLCYVIFHLNFFFKCWLCFWSSYPLNQNSVEDFSGGFGRRDMSTTGWSSGVPTLSQMKNKQDQGQCMTQKSHQPDSAQLKCLLVQEEGTGPRQQQLIHSAQRKAWLPGCPTAWLIDHSRGSWMS